MTKICQKFHKVVISQTDGLLLRLCKLVIGSLPSVSASGILWRYFGNTTSQLDKMAKFRQIWNLKNQLLTIISSVFLTYQPEMEMKPYFQQILSICSSCEFAHENRYIFW